MHKHSRHLRLLLLPLVAAATVAIGATPALGVGWHLDCLDQSSLPLNNWYFPYGSGGVGRTVWIVSTGLDVTHPEFGGRAQCIDLLGGDGSDPSGHGTWLASIVGGETSGVAPNVQLRGVRAFDECGTATPGAVISAIEFIMMNADGFSIAVIPFAVGADATLDSAIANLVLSGVPTIVAAGDSGDDACLYSPARSSYAITVGALDTSFGRSASSNRGSCVDVYAPGISITAAWPGGDTATHDGTAASAAIVAGLVANSGSISNHCSAIGIICGSAPYGGGGGDPHEWYRFYTEPCVADVSCDGAVDISDLLELLGAWGSCADCPSDFDGNGTVDTNDLLDLLAGWGPCA